MIAPLRDPASYFPSTGPVEIFDTHTALAFHAGGYACELKHAAKYPISIFSLPRCGKLPVLPNSS